MKNSKLTNTEIDNLSTNELLDFFLGEAADEVERTRNKFNVRMNHLLMMTFLGILGTIFGGSTIISLVSLISIFGMLLLVIKSNNDKSIAKTSFTSCIYFHMSQGIVDDSNRYIVNKYLERLDLVKIK